MRDLIERLRMTSNMINMGEKISWGQDTGLMDEAADAIEAMQARAEKAEAELREARMQMLSDAGQAAEAYEAQLRAEAACDAVMKDRAQIMAERDKTFALMLERAEKAEAQVDRMREALERIAGFKGAFGFPFPEANSDYGSFAVVLARETLAGDAP